MNVRHTGSVALLAAGTLVAGCVGSVEPIGAYARESRLSAREIADLRRLLDEKERGA